MASKGTQSIDKGALVVQPLDAPSDELIYWLSKSPQERMEALEQMRQTIYGYDPNATRLQRSFEVAELPSR